MSANIRVVNKSVENFETIVKDSDMGGPLLLNDLEQDSFDNNSLTMGQILSRQYDLHNLSDQTNLLEGEHLSLNVEYLLTENVKELDHFNFELKETDSEQLICDLCLKSFQKLRSLITHLAQHTGKYTCLECHKVYKNN